MNRHFCRPPESHRKFAHLTSTLAGDIPTSALTAKMQNQQVAPILHLSLPGSENAQTLEHKILKYLADQFTEEDCCQEAENWFFQLSRPYLQHNCTDELLSEITSTFELIWRYLKGHGIEIEEFFFSLGIQELDYYKDEILGWLYDWGRREAQAEIPTIQSLTPEWSAKLLQEKTEEVCRAIFGKDFAGLYPPLAKALPDVFKEYFETFSQSSQTVNLLDFTWHLKGTIDRIDCEM